MRLGQRFPVAAWKRPVTWAVHLSACAVIDFTWAAWTTRMEGVVNAYQTKGPPAPFVHVWLTRSGEVIFATLIFYAGIQAASYVMDSRARLAQKDAEAARLNEQLSNAQLAALRQQIEPHFLFNTFHAISGLVRAGRNDAAVSMIAGLSDFLRRVLEGSAQQQVALGEEMEFAQKYMDIQKVRFAERLQFEVDVPLELYGAQVPSLILQPMVENAVKHGIAKLARGGAIRIAATRCDEVLTLRVQNDGPRLAEGVARSGIGIANVRTRLRGLYGDAFEFEMRNAERGGVEVSVSLPYVVAG